MNPLYYIPAKIAPTNIVNSAKIAPTNIPKSAKIAPGKV